MKNFKPLLFLLILVGGFAAYFFTPLRQLLTPSHLIALTKSAHELWWIPIVLILVYGIGGLFGLPGSALTLAIGALYGVIPGFFYNVIASNLAAGAGFFGARYLGRDFVSRFLKGKWKEFDEQAASHGFRLTFYLRLVPLFPFNGINFGAGLSKVRFTDYALASFLGMIPGTFVYTYFAASLLSGATGAKEKATFHLILSTILFVLLSLVPVIYKRFRK
ncbi:MAG: TVP38/TMEM64 family protein [Deltaproteobacteria bacterium]|nr:TVP38/TMEM64 family protein [Deltaproteobacteria bacterium]